jgi:hypothetical protein
MTVAGFSGNPNRYPPTILALKRHTLQIRRVSVLDQNNTVVGLRVTEYSTHIPWDYENNFYLRTTITKA